MGEIKNVLICGIGAVGSVYAHKIKQCADVVLKVLVDKERKERYQNNPIIFNGEELIFDYVLPEEEGFKADLIIIATKFDALKTVKDNIENFVKNDTIIIPLLNGVTSEKILAEKYGWNRLLLAYWIGHSAVRVGNKVTQDGVGKIVFGSKQSDDPNIDRLKTFFENNNIRYEVPIDMEYKLWLKYMLNVSTNQPSAILNMTFGQMQENEKFLDFAINLMKEVQKIAEAEGIPNTEKMIPEALDTFHKMSKDGKTSMLQDVLAKRKTEVDMFAGTMIELGKKHNIPVPYNKFMYEMIDIIQNNY